MITCRACQQELPDDASFCGFCGFKLGPIEPAGPPSAEEAASFAPEPALPSDAVSEAELVGADTVLAPRDRLGQQRTATRYPMRVDLTYSSDHNFYTGLTENISTGGLFVATDERAEVGQLLRLQLTIPGFDTPWTVVCEVRWVRTEGDPGGVAGMGLRFVELDSELEAAIDLFIAHREPILAED